MNYEEQIKVACKAIYNRNNEGRYFRFDEFFQEKVLPILNSAVKQGKIEELEKLQENCIAKPPFYNIVIPNLYIEARIKELEK